MGRKVHPLIMRIGFHKKWNSSWVANKGLYAKLLTDDVKIRELISERFRQAAVAKIEIERLTDKLRIRIHTAKPGIVIGRHGQDIERLKSDLKDIEPHNEIIIDIKEVRDPALNAQLVAQNIALQLEKRIAFRRAMKRAIEQAKSVGGKGMKIACKGRLGGREIARKESYKMGKVPLQTFRADIDYGFAQARTTYGYIGVKVWVYKGEVLPGDNILGIERRQNKVSR